MKMKMEMGDVVKKRGKLCGNYRCWARLAYP